MRQAGGSPRRSAAPFGRLLAVALVLGGLTVPTSPAVAASTGTLSFVPASGLDATPLSVVSSGMCSAPATNLQLRVSGPGFASDTNVTPNLGISVYPIDGDTGGYDVPLQDTLRGFAAQQQPPATLTGKYDFTLVCKRPIGRTVYATYTGSVEFSSPAHYHALTPAGSPAPVTSLVTTPAAATSPRPGSTSAAPKTPSGDPQPGGGVAGSGHPQLEPTTRPVATHPVATHQATTHQATTHPARVSAAPHSSSTSGATPSKPVQQSATSPQGSTSSPTDSLPASAPGGDDAATVASPGPRHEQSTPVALLFVLPTLALGVVIGLGLLLRRRHRSVPGLTP